jgi:hypothetical protein
MTDKDIEKYVKEMALLDTGRLMQYIDVERLTICELRKKGLSFGQISKKVNKTRMSVAGICRRCSPER